NSVVRGTSGPVLQLHIEVSFRCSGVVRWWGVGRTLSREFGHRCDPRKDTDPAHAIASGEPCQGLRRQRPDPGNSAGSPNQFKVKIRRFDEFGASSKLCRPYDSKHPNVTAICASDTETIGPSATMIANTLRINPG